jgi:hypothetical protein
VPIKSQTTCRLWHDDRKQLKEALENDTVGSHKTTIEEMEVTQICMKEDGRVLGCIIAGDVAEGRCKRAIYCTPNECIMI